MVITMARPWSILTENSNATGMCRSSGTFVVNCMVTVMTSHFTQNSFQIVITCIHVNQINIWFYFSKNYNCNKFFLFSNIYRVENILESQKVFWLNKQKEVKKRFLDLKNDQSTFQETKKKKRKRCKKESPPCPSD